ncbi:unnamed protein product [Amoebophrya sp. A120]|nr:unnamed protein product [Amoebophrya sp. A120]|eukprot:GSA120T00003764001.1
MAIHMQLFRRSRIPHFARVFQGAKFGLPHPEKADKGGEDAMLLTSKIIGVSDGVGGWSRRGVDAGEYSRALLSNVEKVAEKSNLSQPTRILRKAYDKCRHIMGSATVCLVTLQKDDTVIVTNVGDSAAIIVRPSERRILFKSEEQVHDFNFPKQLGMHSDDMPEHGDVHSVKVQEGDLILCATDGIFDNLFDEDILERLCGPATGADEADAMSTASTTSTSTPSEEGAASSKASTGSTTSSEQEAATPASSENSASSTTEQTAISNLEQRAQDIVKAAFVLSLDPHYNSPFASREKEWLEKLPAALRPKGKGYEGGKPDDISAVLVEIVDKGDDGKPFARRVSL